MERYIYQLEFTTPVRFGESEHSVHLSNCSYVADASLLYSAISNEWVSIFGVEDYEKFVEKVKKDEFTLSGLLPYFDDELYVPKPILYVERDALNKEKDDANSSEIKKKMKKLNFIPISHFNDYLDFVKGVSDLSFDYVSSFATEISNTRASISRESDVDTLPYVVSGYKFHEKSGLYFIIETCENLKEKLDVIMKSLSLTGIGGKRSSGFGKFELVDEAYILDEEYPLYSCDEHLARLIDVKGDYYMSLSIVKPSYTDMSDFIDNENFYKLTKKSGFVFSKDYAKNHLKKKDSYVFDMGSCFCKKLDGSLVDVSTNQGTHPVYLYGKSLYLGVKL
ncbi:MAG: type III-A CRISPR-associated RAMP protein Csm4 [Lachnospirales bacterium]